MHRVSIVYFSQAGTTALLAEAIGRGARADANVDVALLRIRPESIHDELPRQADGTNRIGSFSGLMAQNHAPPGTPPALDPADELSAENFGRYISSSTRRLSRVVA